VISVVIPLYNKEARIISCIESVFKQSLLPDEVIIVNDGSIDRSLEVLRNYIANFSKIDCSIVIINQINQGVSEARNNGVKISKNDYIAFLDADDFWQKDFILNATKLIVEYPQANLITFRHKVYKEGIGWLVPYQDFGSNSDYGLVNDFFKLSSKGSKIVNSSKVVVKKLSFEAVGGFPKGAEVSEDLFLWIKLALNGKFAFSNYCASSIVLESDSSRNHRKGKVPYPIMYYSEHTIPKEDKWLREYLWKIHKMHVLGSLSEYNKEEAKLRLSYGNKIFLRSYILSLISLLPNYFFFLLRKIKNKILSI
jgi:glycosyltransferase involved in cell wall biosynthesis